MDLLLHNLSPQLFDRLRKRAADRGRTIGDEALDLLQAGLEPPGEEFLTWLQSAAEPSIALEAGLHAISDTRAER